MADGQPIVFRRMGRNGHGSLTPQAASPCEYTPGTAGGRSPFAMAPLPGMPGPFTCGWASSVRIPDGCFGQSGTGGICRWKFQGNQSAAWIRTSSAWRCSSVMYRKGLTLFNSQV